MSEPARKKIRWGLAAMGAAGLFVAAFFLLVVYAHPAGRPKVEFLYHLTCGWIPFLIRNLPKMSWNADVWVPGLGTFLASAGMLHFIGRRWARKRERKWVWSQTLALAAALPLLFGISFLVPGSLLQLRSLASGGPMVWSNVGSDATFIRARFSLAAMELRDHLAEYECLPDSLPPELAQGMDFIYLGGSEWDGSSPVLISPAFDARSGRRERILLNSGFKSETIPAEDAGQWIERAITARKRALRGGG